MITIKSRSHKALCELKLHIFFFPVKRNLKYQLVSSACGALSEALVPAGA